MPALDFPALPAVNQQFPVTPIAGLPQYTWDGEKWTTVGAQISNAVPASALPLMDATPAVVGVTTKYAREDHIHPTDTTRADVNAVLLKVPQGLSTTEQTDIRKNIYAAPFDAMAYSGMQINGSMEVSQENGGSAVSFPVGSNKYVVDGYNFLVTGATRTASAAQTPISTLAGFSNCLAISPTTASASLAAADAQYLFHPIEGYRWARMAFGGSAAQSVTIAFWFWSTISGTIAVSLRNSATNRCYVVDVSVVNGWQYKTITIPGDMTGAWLTNNGVGAYVTFCFGAGTNWQGAANTWTASGNVATAATTNFFASTSNQMLITGVVVLPGIEAPSAARSPLIMRPYDQELLTCKRYWQSCFWGSYGSTGVGSNTGGQGMFPVAMRGAPTASANSVPNSSAGITTIDQLTTTSLRYYASVVGNSAYNVFCATNLDARL